MEITILRTPITQRQDLQQKKVLVNKEMSLAKQEGQDKTRRGIRKLRKHPQESTEEQLLSSLFRTGVALLMLLSWRRRRRKFLFRAWALTRCTLKEPYLAV